MPAQVPSFISASNIRLKIVNLIRKREKFDAISLSLKYQTAPLQHINTLPMLELNNTHVLFHAVPTRGQWYT